MTNRMNAGMFMSARSDYETPDELFKQIDGVFNFNLDVCANAQNTKVPDNYITEEQDSLAIPWSSRLPEGHDQIVAWENPPWGTGVEEWTSKAVEERALGATVVALLGARTDTAWFHTDVARANYILYLRGRVKFSLPCVKCGETTDRRRNPVVAMRKALEGAGIDTSGATFPICDACFRQGTQDWFGASTNSPAVGSLLALWLPGRIDIRAADANYLSELGTLVEPWRR